MVWEDPDFEKYYRSLILENDARRGAAAQQIVQNFQAEVGRLGMLSGAHVATMIAEYGGKTIAEIVDSRFRSFETACRAVNIDPDTEDYNKLLSEIDHGVERALDVGIEELQRELLQHRGALGHIPLIKQIADRAKADTRRRTNLKNIEIKRRVPRVGSLRSPIFISHVAQDGEVAAAMKACLKRALGEDLQVFVSSDYESIRSGSDWHGDILEALRKSRVVLVLISKESVTRPWINYEAGVGDGIGAEVIPVAVRGFSKGDLRPPLSRHQARSLAIDADIHALLKDLAECTERPLCTVDLSELIASSASSYHARSDYTPEEIEVLVSASEDGDVYLIENQQARFVRAGGRDFHDPLDPAVEARHVDALFGLVKRGLAEASEGILYTLTGRGFEIARSLASKQAVNE